MDGMRKALKSQTSQPKTQKTSSFKSSCCPSGPPSPDSSAGTSADPPRWLKDGKLLEDELKAEIGQCSEKLLAEGSEAQQTDGADQLYNTMMLIWGLETGELSRSAADIACDEIRLNDGIERMLHLLCHTESENLIISIARALEQVMVSGNRSYISSHTLFHDTVRVVSRQDIPMLMQYGIGILENLFKESTDTCLCLIKDGGLDGVIHGCRSSDPIVLQHCAAAITNCAMYGSQECHELMIRFKVDHWLFPLAFSDDNVVKYYALLGVSHLAANERIIDCVVESGTLDLVLPFLHNRDPDKFAASCPGHAHGRSAGWLSRLKPLLASECEETRSMAAFHFSMESTIKKKQNKANIFKEIGVVENLQIAARKGSKLTACHCCKALRTIDAPLPPYQSWNVLRWQPDQVRVWAEDMGLKDLAPQFVTHMVTGSILLDLCIEDLMEIGLKSRIKGKWIMQQIVKLRCRADVSFLYAENIAKFLTDIHKDLCVYKVDFARRGITAGFLSHLNDEMLLEIGVRSSIDRARILNQISGTCGLDSTDSASDSASPVLPLSARYRKKYDVFISYRRESGAQLASLLKVYLEVRGLSAFLDVASLGGGKFDDVLLKVIGQCSNLVVVLTQNSLKRCMGDHLIEDWLHREVVCALQNNVTVVPLCGPNFTWPTEKQLPADLRSLCRMNAVVWSHEYQDASVVKVVKFLKLPPIIQRRMNSMVKSVSNVST